MISGVVEDEAAQVVIASLFSAADATGGPLVVDLHGCETLGDAAALALVSCVDAMRAAGVQVDVETAVASRVEAALHRSAGRPLAA